MFVGFELRQSRTIAQFEGFVELEEVERNLLSLQIENIDIWQRGCLDEELSIEEKGIFTKMVQAVGIRGFTSWQRANLGLLDVEPGFFTYGVALTRFRFPGFDKAWIAGYSRRSADLSYDPPAGSWSGAVESTFRNLDENTIERNADVSLCG